MVLLMLCKILVTLVFSLWLIMQCGIQYELMLYDLVDASIYIWYSSKILMETKINDKVLITTKSKHGVKQIFEGISKCTEIK